MNALGFTIFLPLVGLLLFGSRRAAVLALLGGMLFLTQAQSLSLGGVHLSAMRLLGLLGALRLLMRGERVQRPGGIDTLVALLYGFTVCVFMLRSPLDRAYLLGISVDAALSYGLFRTLLRDADDLRAALRGLGLMLLPYVGLLLMETTTGRNPFAVIGGLSFVERGGRLRDMGSFRHPSLLGTLGAAFLPLYLALWMEGRQRGLAWMGMALCAAVVVLANSGGPLSAAAFGVLGWCLWPLRARMQLVRRGLVAALIGLAVFMKAPIWYLPAKASSWSGGDGWHRSFLLEMSYRHLDRWWLAGMDLGETSEWFDYQLAATGTADITNQYLHFGFSGGLLSLALFIALLSRAFQGAGRAMAAPGGADGLPAHHLAWGLGCAVVVHASTWMGITYNFDQTYVIWSLQLAAIAVMASRASPTGAQPAVATQAVPQALVMERPW